MSLLLRNCRLISDGKEVIRNILVKGGKIRKITSENISAAEEIDAEFNYVIPGVIDPHVHFREPGFTHKEDFLSGSKAAAAGGITTFLDMPNTKPETVTAEALNEKRRLAKKSVVNYGFHFGGSADDNAEEIKKVKGIASVKVFMNVSTGKMLIKDKKLLKKIFSNSEIISVHAEKDMVKKAIALSKECHNRLYLCHISLGSELDVLRKFKDDNIFAEATPHHLFLTDKDAKMLKGFADMKPSLKTKKDQDALWKAIDEGLIDTIGSDHAPHTIEEKKSKNFPSGVPGCETSLSLMLDAVNKGRISLTKVVQLMSESPARIFRIKNKGKIAVGYDADLVIVDMNLEKKVNSSELFTKCCWSPFNGKTLKGWPITTIVMGEIVFNKGMLNSNIAAKEVKYG
jgi:dihydroorotase